MILSPLLQQALREIHKAEDLDLTGKEVEVRAQNTNLTSHGAHMDN